VGAEGTGFREVRRAGARFLVRADRAEAVEWDLLPALGSLAGAPGVTVVKENTVRTVLRVPFGGGTLILKRYHSRGLLEAAKSLVRSRPRTEWRIARAMEAVGLPAVRAVLMGERRRGGVLREGFFATEEVTGGSAVVPWLVERFAGRPEDPGRRALLFGLARLVRRFHDAGFVHGDLHGGNLLVTGEPGAAEIRILDLHTVRGPGRVSRRARFGNVAKLLHSLGTVTAGADRAVFLDDYEGAAPVLGGREALPAIEAAIGRLELRRLASRSKRCVKQSTTFTNERIGHFRMWRRREVPSWAPLHAVGDHLLSAWRKTPEVLKHSRRSILSRQVLPGSVEQARVVVKETRCRSTLDWLKNVFRTVRGLKSFVNGNALAVRGVPVARPLAALVAGRWPIRGGSWLIMEDLCDLTRIDLFVLKRYAGALTPAVRAEKVSLVKAFGRFVGDLHRRGIYHGDMKAVNVFVMRAADGTFGFRLVDYDRVRFGRRVSRRRRVKNLAQIAASVAVLVTKTDRLRFFRAYVFDEDGSTREKQYARGVLAEVRRKIVVKMDPIE
jgi:tRNA A-37 threonylcarbamoyl transferase component Bud32